VGLSTVQRWLDASREQALRDAEADLARFAGLGHRAIDLVNASLINAFDERIVYTPITRAFPLLGGVDAWTRDIEQVTAHLSDVEICALRDDMLKRHLPGGRRVQNRPRVHVST
jgi:hypothetical protein